MKSFVNVEITCPFCGAPHYVLCDEVELDRWQAGELIQVAMPSLTATEREELISGICPDCQSSIFGSDEDEDWEPDDLEVGFDPYACCYSFDC